MTTIYIFPNSNKSYLKITHKGEVRNNIGCIENNGRLNVKPELREMIAIAGGSFSKAPSWEQSNGPTRGVGGTGYDSYAKFSDSDAVISYLKIYFNVQLK